MFLFLNQKICCGYPNPSQLNGSFEHPKRMFKLKVKKNSQISAKILNWPLAFKMYMCWLCVTAAFLFFEYTITLSGSVLNFEISKNYLSAVFDLTRSVLN